MTYADITLPNIEKLFKKFNTKYFNDTLPLPNFCVKTNRRALGHCAVVHKEGESPIITITISNYYVVPPKDFEQTLLHEMIHLKQFVTFGTMSHGATFKNMAETINKDSRGRYAISRCSSRLGYELSNEAKLRVEKHNIRKSRIQILTV